MENPPAPKPQIFEHLQQRLQPHQLASFFDNDPNDPRSQKPLWISPNKIPLIDPKSKVIVEGTMEKQGRKIPLWKVRHFILTEDFLAYKEKQGPKKFKRVMVLDRVRLEIIVLIENNNKRYGFKFTKNKKSASIFTNNQQLYEKFRSELEKRCILITFDEDYEIEKLIGQGSFGKVYLVKRRSDEKEFAAKMFFEESLLKQTKGKLSLVNEIKTLRKLDHPGIMKLYRVYETTKGIFLIMELLSGGELFEHLKAKKTFTERDCAFMLIRIMDPLAYMHEHQIVHRDIKPENLILRSRKDSYDIVIADFGLAQALNQPALFVKCGSPGYCAPEILHSKGDKIMYDTKCDVFSVGCVFYHMITGKHPFWSKYPKETYHLNKETEVMFEDPKITVLSSAAQDLLKQMLIRDPRTRFNFKQCLSHHFFQEAFQAQISPVVNFRPKPLNQANFSYVKSGELEQKEKSKCGSNLDMQESFVYGRSNIIKGKIDTLQDITIRPIENIIKKNIMQLSGPSENFSFHKYNPTKTTIKEQATLKDDSDSNSGFDDSLNESSEIGKLAWIGKPLEIALKVAQVKNAGVMNNPFFDSIASDKDVFSNYMKAMVSAPLKSSFVTYSS